MKTLAVPAEIRLLYNHIYEYKKGIRNLILYTINKRHFDLATQRLNSQNIPFLVQPVGNSVNLYFGQSACLDTIRTFINRPLNELTPEEDFILGALLGYDLCAQCRRFCSMKKEKCKVA